MKSSIASLCLLLLAGAVMLDCGSPSAHDLQSVTISPATADAQNFPGGQVQFTATGIYSTQPSPVTPFSATWGSCYQSTPTNAVSVTSSGLAQCVPGAPGTYTVWAYGPDPAKVNCTAINACGGGCGRITGTASLTCP